MSSPRPESSVLFALRDLHAIEAQRVEEERAAAAIREAEQEQARRQRAEEQARMEEEAERIRLEREAQRTRLQSVEAELGRLSARETHARGELAFRAREQQRVGEELAAARAELKLRRTEWSGQSRQAGRRQGLLLVALVLVLGGAILLRLELRPARVEVRERVVLVPQPVEALPPGSAPALAPAASVRSVRPVSTRPRPLGRGRAPAPDRPGRPPIDVTGCGDDPLCGVLP